MPNQQLTEWWKMDALAPIFGQQGIANQVNTGAGPDGVVQPNQPAMAIGGTMVHEGETLGPDGQVTPAPMGSQTPEDQAKLREMEATGQYNGMQFGGDSEEVSDFVNQSNAIGPINDGADFSNYNPRKDTTANAKSFNAPALPQMAPATAKPATEITAAAKPVVVPEMTGTKGAPGGEPADPTALDKLKGVMTLDDPYFQSYMDKQTQDLAGAATARAAGAVQDAAARGAGPAAIGGLQTTMARDAMQQQGDVVAKTAIDAQGRAIDAAGQVMSESRLQYQDLLAAGDTEGAAKHFAESISAEGVDLTRVEDDIQWAIENRGYEDMVGMFDNITSWAEAGLIDANTASALGGMMKNVMVKNLLAKADFSDTDTQGFIDELNTSAKTGDPLSPGAAAQFVATASLIESFSEQDEDVFNGLVSEHPELKDGSDENTSKLGLIAKAYINQTNLKPNSSEAIAALKEYGLYDEALDEGLRVSRVKLDELNTLSEAIGESGSLSKFKTKYNQVVAGDPAFAKEHPMSEFIGQVDTFLDAEGKIVYPSADMVDELMTLGVDGSDAVVDGGMLTGDLWYENKSDIYGSSKSERWSLNTGVANFVDANIGKIVMIDDKPYLLQGREENVDKRGDRAYVNLYDLTDKTTVQLGKK